jgi:ribokinase
VTIIDKLKHLSIVGSIVVMPDFFVDRIIRLESKESLFDALTEKAKLGGGSVRGVPTKDVKGGNAVNIAYCLAKLGAKISLFTVADEFGATMIRQTFSQFGDRVTLRIFSGRTGFTTAFEFPHEDTRKCYGKRYRRQLKFWSRKDQLRSRHGNIKEC